MLANTIKQKNSRTKLIRTFKGRKRKFELHEFSNYMLFVFFHLIFLENGSGAEEKLNLMYDKPYVFVQQDLGNKWL